MAFEYFAVNYMLDEQELERLKNIRAAYQKRQGLYLDMEEQFELIMTHGSKWEIDRRFKNHEIFLGLKKS